MPSKVLSGKPSMISVEVQTDAVEFKHDDVVSERGCLELN